MSQASIDTEIDTEKGPAMPERAIATEDPAVEADDTEAVDVAVVDVEAVLFFRAAVGRLGVAPLTSMFWFSETNHQPSWDWRPEVHDSDGLALWTGAGELSGGDGWVALHAADLAPLEHAQELGLQRRR